MVVLRVRTATSMQSVCSHVLRRIATHYETLPNPFCLPYLMYNYPHPIQTEPESCEGGLVKTTQITRGPYGRRTKSKAAVFAAVRMARWGAFRWGSCSKVLKQLKNQRQVLMTKHMKAGK